MKEEFELISDSTKVSFVCSFGYDIRSREPAKNRMNDMYVFRNLDTHAIYEVQRKDFFKFINEMHGGVKRGRVHLNSAKDYDLFCYGSIKTASKFTRSRVLRDLIWGG